MQTYTITLIEFKNGLNDEKKSQHKRQKEGLREGKDSKTPHTHKYKKNYQRNARECHYYIKKI